ncbi:MAG: hypothetical protein ABH805_02605 [Candidatus Nealsonbacteria bacterium]
MKKIIIPVLVFLLFSLTVITVNSQDVCAKAEDSQQGQGTGQGQQVQTETEQQTQNQGEEQQIRTEQQTQIREDEQTEGSGQQNLISGNQQKARTMTEAREMVQQKKQAMTQEMQGLSNIQQKVYQNQNKVREAVHALLALEDLAPGIGLQVSQIAREFNNSVQATIMAEEKIQKRSVLVRFFTGGEKNAAGDMEQELNQNQQRIQELKQLREESVGGEEVKAMMQEQIQNMEQEQVRLQQLVDREKSANGVFGWVRNLFRWGR